MKLNSKTTRRYAAWAARGLYQTTRAAAARPSPHRATGKITTLALRRVDMRSAFRFGLIFGPLLYTLVGLALWLNGVGTGHVDYLVGVVKAIIFGGAGGLLFALVYNAIARRYGPLTFDLEVMIHESQDNARPR